MTTRAFLNLYIISALLFSASLWTVAASSARFADYASVSIRKSRGSDPVSVSVPPLAGSVKRSQQAVRSVSPSLNPGWMVGEGSLQVFEGGAAWKDTQVSRTCPPWLDISHGPKGDRVSGRGASCGLWADFASGGGDAWVSERVERPAGIKPGRHLRTLATNAANLCGVPASLFHRLIQRESGWDPDVVSHSGARGLAQIKDSTLLEVSPTLRPGVVWDGLLGGACYLRKQYDRFGTWPAALHAYRVGPSAKPSKVGRDYAAAIMGDAQ